VATVKSEPKMWGNSGENRKIREKCKKSGRVA